MSDTLPGVKYLVRVHDIADRYCDVGVKHCDAGRCVAAMNMAHVVPWNAMRHAREDCAAFDRALGRKPAGFADRPSPDGAGRHA